MAVTPKVFVLLGRGGAGKTESASFVLRATGLPVIELGNEIRRLYQGGDATAWFIVHEFIKKGKYFPGEYSLDFLDRVIGKNPKKFSNGFIIDRFPRKPEDIPAFESFLEDAGFRMGSVIELKVPLSVSSRRQLRRRRESKESIQRREGEFLQSERSVMAHYRKQGKLFSISAQLSGRKRRQSFVPFELTNPKFLKRTARKVRVGIKQLKRRK